MADQAITALPKKTYSGSSQIASTDYLLGIDSAEGYQMLIQDLGEYIINRATASLAGSTQTLASAISALNSNMTTLKNNNWYRNVDLNTFTQDGVYYIADNITNCYESAPWAPMRVFSRGGIDSFRQLMLAQNGSFMYRYQTGNTWSDWTRLPTRAEVDALTGRFGNVGNLIQDFDDANFFKAFFTRQCSSVVLPFATAALHQPITNPSWGCCLLYFGGNNSAFFIVYIGRNGDIYTRLYDSAWLEWKKIG